MGFKIAESEESYQANTYTCIYAQFKNESRKLREISSGIYFLALSREVQWNKLQPRYICFLRFLCDGVDFGDLPMINGPWDDLETTI